MPRHVTSQDEARARLAELHATGMSARKIAERIGVSRQTVSRWAKEDGLKFDRAQTKAATAALVVDMAALRAIEARASIVDAARLRERAWQRYTQVVATKDGAERVELDLPPLDQVRNAYAAYGIAIDKHMALARFDGDGSEGERSMLAELGRALGIGA